MVTFDYKIEPPIGIDYIDFDPEHEIAAALEYGLFYGHIRFRVNEVAFDTRGAEEPVLGWAIGITWTINGKRSIFNFPESSNQICFRNIGQDVEISANYVDLTARISYDELRRAVHSFLHQLLNDLSSQWPLLCNNPSFRQYYALIEGVGTNMNDKEYGEQ